MTRDTGNSRCVGQCVLSDVGSIAVIGSEEPLCLCVLRQIKGNLSVQCLAIAV